MATSKVTYLGDLRTSSIHLQSGSEIISDAPLDNNGKGEAFSQTDTVANGLATCMLTVMGIKARDLDVDFSGSSVPYAQCALTGLEVVAVLVTGRDRHHARRHHVRIGVQHAGRIAAVDQRPGDDLGQIKLARDLAQHHETTVGGQVAGIPRGCEWLARDG